MFALSLNLERILEFSPIPVNVIGIGLKVNLRSSIPCSSGLLCFSWLPQVLEVFSVKLKDHLLSLLLLLEGEPP